MKIQIKLQKEIEINSKEDLKELKKIIEVNGLEKPNFSELSRRLGIDRRTVKKYYNGEEKKERKARASKVDKYEEIIRRLLDKDCKQIFYYKSHLYRYLEREYGLEVTRNTFNHYILKKEEFADYFKKRKKQEAVKTETPLGKQAQFDWKENIKFEFNTGEEIEINIGLLILSASRQKVANIYISKDQENLLDFLTRTFEQIEGVPKQLVIDNAKTMMTNSRTTFSKGKPNKKFEQYANDFGFTIKPCLSKRPQTKAKVESPMRIIDEILNYNGVLDNIEQLHKKLEQIIDEANLRVCQATDVPPIVFFKKEKEHLLPLPSEKVRSSYKSKSYEAKVNLNGLFNFKNKKYSVPAEYSGKTIKINTHDNRLYVYYNRKIVRICKISEFKTNYSQQDHLQMFKMTFNNRNDIENQAELHFRELEVFNEQLSQVIGKS